MGWSMVTPCFRQLMLRVRTMARSLDVAPSFKPDEAAGQVVALLLGISTLPVMRSCIGTVDSLPVTEALASAPQSASIWRSCPTGCTAGTDLYSSLWANAGAAGWVRDGLVLHLRRRRDAVT